MNKCIYCLWVEAEFTWREHVIPQMFGKFTNNPVLGKWIVCDKCNSTIFSSLETIFKKETMEWYFCQMLNLSENNCVIIGRENLDINNEWGLKSDVFSQMFPFIDWKWNIKRIDQIAVIKEKTVHIFPLQNLLNLYDQKENNQQNIKKFKKYKSLLSSVSKYNIRIYTTGEESHTIAVKLLNDLWIGYKPANVAFEKLEKIKEDGVLHQHSKVKFSSSTLRIIAKTAFNYFSYCCFQEGLWNFLYTSTFDRIRGICMWKFDLQPWGDVQILNKAILDKSQTEGKRVVAHQIVFYKENDTIYSEISFFWTITYKIAIWNLYFDIQNKTFWCWHLFDPFTWGIFNLTNDQSSVWKKNYTAPVYWVFGII